MVDRVKGTPARAAARAVASSPSGWTMRGKPAGASTSGRDSGAPSTEEPGSTCSTAFRTWGRQVVAAKAASLAASVRSSSAPPST